MMDINYSVLEKKGWQMPVLSTKPKAVKDVINIVIYLGYITLRRSVKLVVIF